MSEAGPVRTPRREPPEVLEAKYLEYCSAQLAELLLYLSPDEIYLLAQKARSETGEEGEMSYVAMVEVATTWLADRIALPPFEVWVEDYSAHPDRYGEYFMGLWESETPATE